MFKWYCTKVIYNDKLPCTFVICMCYQKLVLPWARTSYTTAITVPLQAAICSWFALCDRNLSNFLLKLVMFHLVTGNFTCLKLTLAVDFANSTSCTSTNLFWLHTTVQCEHFRTKMFRSLANHPIQKSPPSIFPATVWCFVRNPGFTSTSWGRHRLVVWTSYHYFTSGFYIALSQNGGWSFPGAKKSWSLNRLVHRFQQSLPRENSCTSATQVLEQSLDRRVGLMKNFS